MKRENYAKEKALLNAEKINSVRKNHVGSINLVSNWTSLLRDAGVQYIHKMASELRKLGYLKKAVDSEYGYELGFFEFTDKPIYYKDLIPIFREIYDYNQKKSPNAKSKSERPRTFSIANHGVSITDSNYNNKDEIMDTIKIYDFSKIISTGRGLGSRLRKNQMAIYVLINENGTLGNHTLSFSNEADFYKQGKMFLSVGENQITGEIYLMFSDKYTGKEVELRKPNGKSGRITTSRNTIVRFIANKLGVDVSKGINEVFSLSENLSRIPSIMSYKVIK